jgi:hypothetical protein
MLPRVRLIFADGHENDPPRALVRITEALATSFRAVVEETQEEASEAVPAQARTAAGESVPAPANGGDQAPANASEARPGASELRLKVRRATGEFASEVSVRIKKRWI